MGLLRFWVHDQTRVALDALDRMYVTTYEQIPKPNHVYWNENQLIIERDTNESCYVHIPWITKENGEWFLTTATLLEREKPYLIEVELVRGTLNRLRNQLAAWEAVGLQVSETFYNELRHATQLFSTAVTNQENRANAVNIAQQTLTLTLKLTNKLTELYSNQAILLRQQTAPTLPTLLGVRLDQELPQKEVLQKIPSAFNLVSIPTCWKSLEFSEGKREWNQLDTLFNWSQQQKSIRSCVGPLISFDDANIPDWVFLWEENVSAITSLMVEHVRAVVSRYRGKVNLWHVAARMNRNKILSLSEEDRLAIVASCIQAIREIDHHTPLIVSFDQPWGEYLAHQPMEFAPLHFADALIRSNLDIAGLGLELNMGHGPHHSAPRSPLALSRMLDEWSHFELPLVLMTNISSEAPENPPKPYSSEKNKTSVNPLTNDETIPLDETSKLRETEVATFEQTQNHQLGRMHQKDWVQRYLPMMLAKNSVQVIIWNSLTDGKATECSKTGLFDLKNKPKPALEILQKYRQDFLN